jgi:hypothetical protein
VSGQASYDVYVKSGLDPMGRDEFGEAVAHFVERGNAVALKRRLVARGESVHVVRNVVHGLTETEKKKRFSDFHLVPEYKPPSDHGPAKEPSETPQATGEGRALPPLGPDAEEASREETAGSWWRRWLGA